MTLRPITELLADAQRNSYALGYFESWNIESLLGVIDAAEGTRSPVIIGFNGEFLSSPDRLLKEDLTWYGVLGKAVAENASVPCGFIFNECPFELQVRKAVGSGFNLVMLSAGNRSYAQYVRDVAGLVEFAHPKGVSVEAEIDELPSGETGELQVGHSLMTDPVQAARFVEATGVDILSISVGNIHVLLEGEQDLDLVHLAEIRRQVAIPLGLHGGSGISASSLQKAIQLGVAKVNYGTYLKQRYLAATRRALDTEEVNPHRMLGMGGEQDILTAGRLAVRDAILERIEILGCCGRA
jgi:ketose-bisphosphate aldolase